MPGINTTSYEDLFQEHLLDRIENKVLTDIKMMLEKKVESLTKMVVDRNATIRRLDETVSRLCEESKEKKQELREKERVLSDRHDIIMRQADKLLKLQQHIDKMKELCTYGDYEETNEWVDGCKKRGGYDDSQGQTPPGHGSTQPTRETSYTPKQSYDYRKVGL